MRYIFLILLVFLSGCVTPRFTPSGERGKQVEYFYGNNVCDRCHKKCIFFKKMNKKKVICADCYDKYYR